jgi:hypothetical protein
MNPTLTTETPTPTRSPDKDLLGRMDPMAAYVIRSMQNLQDMLTPRNPAFVPTPIDQCLCGSPMERDSSDWHWHCPECGAIWSDD